MGAAQQLPLGLAGGQAAAGALVFLELPKWIDSSSVNASGLRDAWWVATRDGRVMYQSPAVPWYGGDRGSWWVGFAGDGEPIGTGAWELEVYLDDQPMARGKVELR